MTPEQIKALAKQAGGTISTDLLHRGQPSVIFDAENLAEFVRLVLEGPEGMQLVPKPRYVLSECPDCSGEGECIKFGYDDYTNGFCMTCNGTGKAPVLKEQQ